MVKKFLTLTGELVQFLVLVVFCLTETPLSIMSTNLSIQFKFNPITLELEKKKKFIIFFHNE